MSSISIRKIHFETDLFSDETFACLLRGGSTEAAAVVDDLINPHYKGASSFNLVGVGPNVARCGAFPENRLFTPIKRQPGWVYKRSKANIERLVNTLRPLNPYLRGAPAPPTIMNSTSLSVSRRSKALKSVTFVSVPFFRRVEALQRTPAFS